MDNKIFCSTGTMIGRVNNFDHTLAIKSRESVHADGWELMILPPWYPDLAKILCDFDKAGVGFDTIHADKEIGIIISGGDRLEYSEAKRRFEINCDAANAVGAKKMIFHLWGGPVSDSHFENCERAYYDMKEIAQKHKITLTIENIPCTTRDPISVFHDLIKADGDVRFTFDTRFGAFHDQLTKLPDDKEISGRICHMHISDYTGCFREWGKIRPIVHPGEGVIDFDKFLPYISKIYHGTVTLESPVMCADGSVDLDKLNKTLDYIKEMTRSGIDR
ncbi:MAG: sugar phosphate isomerase/epimerase [Clostridia bacterium]|nr:sugar phosphate isomerase/epimerase [Clostridia bacterium]